MTYKNGASYNGEWANGLRHGKGLYKYTRSSAIVKYKGSYVNDLKWGYGVQEWKNGGKYAGEWKNGLRNGMGNFTYGKNDPSQRKLYVGNWKEGKQSGLGTLYYIHGGKYEGEKVQRFKARNW